MTTASTAGNSEKGVRYFAQLDQALCNANWAEVPELARKTEKHAPQRKSFTLAARSEAQVAYTLQHSTSTAAPSSPGRAALGSLTSSLKDAASKAERYPEDTYVAKVCLAEIYWLQDEYAEAVKVLPGSERPSTSATSRGNALGWLEVCEVKAELIRLVALVETSQHNEARQACLKIAAQTPGSRTPELRKWTERLLARICLFMHQRTKEPTLQSLDQALRCFHAWSDFWQRTSFVGASATATLSKIDVPRRRVWRAYYGLVSTILQYGLTYNLAPKSTSDLLIAPSHSIHDEDYESAKARQRSALRKVEANYESSLLNETQFPKASQTNTDIEEWVEQVVSNWKILSGPAWADATFGEGGKESLGRGVLDILYRAATKTFHSTTILRYLFNVHAAIGEFDLAMHAFNSYVEIVSKERARAEKTGAVEQALDSDDSAILTAVEAVRVLCRYGDRSQGEKAVGVGKTIKNWLGETKPAVSSESSNHVNSNHTSEAAESPHHTPAKIKPQTLASAHRAIGISQAHWARLTYETHLRSKIQDEALESLRLAQAYDEDSIETGYALALILAESRNIAAAITILKYVIASSGSSGAEVTVNDTISDFGRARSLLPVWHLLALCLTAQDGYEQAVRICEAAFDQFGDSTVLYGEPELRISEGDEKAAYNRRASGLADLMEGYEKETMIQIKISQLTLLELMEGVEAAVDASHELLGLYARLFGSPDFSRPITTPQPPRTAVSAAPSRIGGTLRSIAGSIRPRSTRQSMEKDPRMASTVSVSAQRDPPVNNSYLEAPTDENAGIPIAITVTNEDGVPTERSRHLKHMPFRRRGDLGSVRTTGSSTKARNTIAKAPDSVRRGDSPAPNARSVENSTAAVDDGQKQPDETPLGPEQPLELVPHNTAHDEMPPPPGHENQPPRQDVRLPAPHPSTYLIPDAHLPTAQDRQQSIALLMKIWLFISGLYLRAELLEDAGSAMDEAKALVDSFETEVGSEDSSAQRLRSKGWGGGKSVDGLWADVWFAKGSLALARGLPFEALSSFEQALAHFPDHADAIIGISNLLMDIYEGKIPAEEPERPLAQQPSASNPTINSGITPAPLPARDPQNVLDDQDKPAVNGHEHKGRAHGDPTPAELNRLAARDRAHMLLTTLTRLDSGWDNTEAWYTLARAHELSKQISKAKEALWWVVELEANEPMRPWSEVAAGGYTL